MQFLVKQRTQLAPTRLVSILGMSDALHLFFHEASPRYSRPSYQSRSIGHAIKPIADSFARFDRVGLAHEDEKSGLKSIVGIVRVAKQTPAHTQHHSAMSAQQ